MIAALPLVAWLCAEDHVLRMGKMNSFTARLHEKGYKRQDFYEYWTVSPRTYERMMADPSRHDKLNKMIEGMR